MEHEDADRRARAAARAGLVIRRVSLGDDAGQDDPQAPDLS